MMMMMKTMQTGEWVKKTITIILFTYDNCSFLCFQLQGPASNRSYWIVHIRYIWRKNVSLLQLFVYLVCEYIKDGKGD